MSHELNAANARPRGLLRAIRLPLMVGILGVCVMGQRGCCRGDELPLVQPDDAGHYSWVRQMVPIVLGRKVKGYSELKFLADLAAETDRPTVLRALMQQPEFREHWAEVLINQLKVDREGFRSQQDCYGPPLRTGPGEPAPTLAQFIRDNEPSMAAPGAAFNMSDVVRSALVLDDLAPIYRAHLFAQQHHPPFFGADTPQTRDELGRDFGHTYLHRQNLCMTCHNSDNSTTGPGSGWNRHFPILGSFEKSLYGANSGTNPLFAHAMFRTDQHSDGATPGYSAPWNMSGCGFFLATVPSGIPDNPYFTGPLPDGATVTTLANLFAEGYQGLALDGLNRTVPAAAQASCTFCSASCSGGAPADPESVTNGPFVRDLLRDTSGEAGGFNCGDCHGDTQDLWFVGSADPWHAHLIGVSANTTMGVRVDPGNASASVLIKKLRGTAGGEQMPLGCSPAGPMPTCVPEADIQKVEAWVNALAPTSACGSCPNLNCDPTEVDGKEAFAYLVAARIVETVWQEAMGYPVTVANYFPRNYEQRGVLWNLTEHVFIANDWSLRELLVRILTSNFFNRHAPHVMAASANPYSLPMIYEPWVSADPRTPPASAPGYDPAAHSEAHFNAMTDGIYRYTARNLLNSTRSAMSWPAPGRFPSASYPNRDFQETLGQYLSGETPGFRSTHFAALLRWEKEHGACANRDPGGADDWIDRLVAASASFVPPGGEGPLTLRDLVVVERDWLLGDGTVGTVAPPGLAQGEEQSLEAYLGLPLSTAANTLAVGDLEAKLRGVCGVLLESPHFLLAGVAPEALGTKPRMRVCNQTPCTYEELCNDLAGKVSLPTGSVLLCGQDSVRVTSLIPVKPIPVKPEGLCKANLCKFIPWKVSRCLENPGVCSFEPPACDPRCATIDCCGGPLPPLDREGLFVTWADGGVVKLAQRVRILRLGEKRFQPLETGVRLAYGDLLEVPPTASLSVEGRGFDFASEPGSEDSQEERTRYLLVTGERAMALVEKPPVRKPLEPEQLDWLRTRGRLQWPDGAQPLRITPEMRGPGELEKNWPKQGRQEREPKRR